MSRELQKTFSQELQKSQLSKEYKNYVEDVLKMYYAHSLRALPDNFSYIVGAWTLQFTECGIPATKLQELYTASRAGMQSGDYFNIDTMIKYWNETRDTRQKEALSKRICTVCKGKKTIGKYNFETQKDELLPCTACQ